MKVERTSDELLQLLEEQLMFLESSSLAYDKGFEGEIKRLAVAVRVLVHDTEKSTSLLHLLNKKNDKYFCDTALPVNDSSLAAHSSLTRMVVRERGSSALPLLDEGPFDRRLSFEEWWGGVVFVDNERNQFSRKDIVLALANKEGGAHVDNSLDKAYADLRKANLLGWYDIYSDGREVPGGGSRAAYNAANCS